jgi:hypothetical protein
MITVFDSGRVHVGIESNVEFRVLERANSHGRRLHDVLGALLNCKSSMYQFNLEQNENAIRSILLPSVMLSTIFFASSSSI